MTSSTRNNISLVGIVLVLFLCYKFAIAETIALGREYNNLKNEEVLFKDIPVQLSVLKSKEQHYDSVLKKMNLGNTSLENNLLRALNGQVEKHGLKLLDFNEPHAFQDGENQLNTFHFSLEGNFTDILSTVHTLEQKGNFGALVHLDFQTKRNYRANKNYLVATVLMQYVQ
ncbi:hypothetical protein WIW50_02100 [Flavobacteriaceae bacterium 3-367]|uniref:hypothetical protein n=1 Tax=Eudoraea algarum TaxID=3417568 RepID=UPI00326DDC86